MEIYIKGSPKSAAFFGCDSRIDMKQNSFLKGAAVLGIIGLVCKVIGAVYRIPMTNLLGTSGMAYYSTPYPVYTWLLVISSAGLPVAISKMVSERVTFGDYKGAHQVFKTALKALGIIGIVTTLAMMLSSGLLAGWAGRPEADIGFLAIAPSLFFVSVLSAYRGYFQGLQMMSPTAFSQLIEQLGKLGLGLYFANLWKANGVAYGAAGAVLGVTLSELLALIFIMIVYFRHKGQIRLQIMKSSQSKSLNGVGRQLFYLAFPIILGALAMPSVQTADLGIVTNSLLGMGYSASEADALYGNISNVVNPLVNMPAILSLALAMSLVPAISESKARKDEAGAAKKADMGFKLALLVGLPCAVGFYFLAQPIIGLLYSSVRGQELQTAGSLLEIMAAGVLFLTIVQTTTGILQGLGKTYVPVINLFIGVAVKIAASLILIRIPELNIKGAAIGTAACYFIAGVLDIVCVIKYARFRLKLLDHIIKPLFAAGVMGIFVYLTYPLLANMMLDKLATVLEIALAGLLYLTLVFAFVLKKDDMVFLPGGGRITRVMEKLRIW